MTKEIFAWSLLHLSLQKLAISVLQKDFPPGINGTIEHNVLEEIMVSIHKPFAQFLQNETQNFSFFAHQFCAKKNNNLRNHSQKTFRSKLPYSAFAKLKFCAIPQFRTKIRYRLSSKSLDNFSFGHAYFLKVDSSGIGYFLALFYMR